MGNIYFFFNYFFKHALNTFNLTPFVLFFCLLYTGFLLIDSFVLDLHLSLLFYFLLPVFLLKPFSPLYKQTTTFVFLSFFTLFFLFFVLNFFWGLVGWGFHLSTMVKIISIYLKFFFNLFLY